MQSSEEDLLALYLNNGRKFPNNYNLFFVDGNLWEEFLTREEYKAKKLADQPSYIWDRLIEFFCTALDNDNLESNSSLTDVEQVIRVMARENRFARRVLGKVFFDFVNLSNQQGLRSRTIPSLSGILYIFLATPHGIDRQLRIQELQDRSFVARGLNSQYKTVIGITIEQYEGGFPLDFIYLDKPSWTEEDQAYLESLQKEFGYSVQQIQTPFQEKEYPSVR